MEKTSAGTRPGLLQTSHPALVIIDVQQAIDCFSDYERNNMQAERQMATLLRSWRQASLPVIHVRHSSKFPESPYHSDSPYFAFKSEVEPAGNELVFTKHENCAFIDTGLAEHLKQSGITELVICGVLTNNSVDATVRVAAGLGFSVFVPHDATAAFGFKLLNGESVAGDSVHWIFLSNLHGEYCQVCSVAELNCV